MMGSLCSTSGLTASTSYKLSFRKLSLLTSLEKFAVYGFVCFFIVQIFSDSVSAPVHDLISVLADSQELHRLSYNTRMCLFVTLSLSIHCRLYKAFESIQWIILNETINLRTF